MKTFISLIFFAALMGNLALLAGTDGFKGPSIPLLPLIEAGQENPTGGYYCFGGSENYSEPKSMWGVFGPQWPVALAHPRNEHLRGLLGGNPRRFTKDGVLYYSVTTEECVFAPPGMRTQVQMVKVEEGESAVIKPIKETTETKKPPSVVSVLCELIVFSFLFFAVGGSVMMILYRLWLLSQKKK